MTSACNKPTTNKHDPPYVVPDYRIYKLEDAPQLKETQIALQMIGLRDPWIRNEIWRFNKKEFGTVRGRVYLTFFRGLQYGFVAFVATVIGNTLYKRAHPESHGILVDFFRK